MSYKGLPELPEFYEPERPQVSEVLLAGQQITDDPVLMLGFSDPLARAYWKRWLESKAGYEAFGTWVDARP